MRTFALYLIAAIGTNMLLIVGFLTSIIFWKKLINKWVPFLIGFGLCAVTAIGCIIGKRGTLAVIVFVVLSITFSAIIALKSKKEN